MPSPIQDIAMTIFAQHDNTLVLERLCGVITAADRAPERAQGHAVLNIDGRRYEAGDLRPETIIEDAEHTLARWRVGDTGVRLTTEWDVCPATGVVSRRDTLVNAGASPVVVSRCLARIAFPSGRYECYSQASRWCHENQGAWQDLHGGFRLGHASGRTTEGGAPYLCVRQVGASRGVAFHILAVGNWCVNVRSVPQSGNEPFAVVELGLSDDDLHRTLAAGDTLPLPELLFQPVCNGEPHRAAAAFHRFLLSRYFADAKAEAPVVYNTWFDQFEVLDVPRLRRQLAAAREVGCEVLVVDAGWFGAGAGNWSTQIGDWREKTDAAFHGNMVEFADEVRREGLGFGLWMEPERFGPDAPIRTEHPEWFVPVGSAARIDLTQPQARRWMRSEIGRLVETYSLAWMKIDFNFSLGTDDSGAELYDYYVAWYALLDEVRAAYPNTFFEGCASGALRTDIEALRHFDNHFISDSVNPVDVLRISQGAWLRLPPGRLGRWAVLRSAGQVVPRYGQSQGESPSLVLTPRRAVWEPAESVELDTALLTAMCGMMGFSGDLAGLTDEHRTRIAQAVAFYKTWRKDITGSEAHMLTPPEPIGVRTGWVGVQLRSPAADTNLVFVYAVGIAGAPPPMPLYGLCPEQTYRVTRGFDGENDGEPMSGKDLMRDGLPLERYAVGDNQAEVFAIRPE
jgi:alpha-galactosidase